MRVLLIVISEPANYFSIFYQLAFLIPFILLLLVGIKRKYDMASWLVIMLASAFFFLLGTRILTFTSVEWKELFISGVYPESYNKFALGGLFLALPMIEVIRRFLKFNRPVLSAFAWIVPIGLAIQKIGCLISGCCYGIPTSLPWGIKYSSGIPPYLDQVNSGLISGSAALSRAIHPTQAYQIIIYIIIAALTYQTIRKNWSERRTVLLAVVLLMFSRFLIEFLVDTDATNFGVSVFLGLKLIQWCCLILGTLSVVVLLLKAGNRFEVPVRVNSEVVSLVRPLIVLVALAGLFILLHNVFSSLEIIAFNIRFLLIITLLVIALFYRVTLKRLRFASVLLIFLPILLVSQTVKKGPYDRSKTLSFGSSFGHYANEIRYNPQGGGCDGDPTYDRAHYENSKFSLQGEFAFTGTYSFRKYRYGSYLTGGSLEELNIDSGRRSKLNLIYASPFAEYNWKGFGVGGQIHLGNIPYIPAEDTRSVTLPPVKNHQLRTVLPGAMLRLGQIDILYLRFDYNYISTAALPLNHTSLSMGTGLGSKNSNGLRVGLSLNNPENFFLEGDFWFTDNFGIWATYMKTGSFTSDMNNSNLFSLGFRTKLKD